MSEAEYTPSQKEIREECERIRAGWSEYTKRKRGKNDRPVDTGIVRWILQEPEGEE